ncbi:uncharacterized protein LOC120730097 [Simochromis diagramma]|uniref:uncharacterized protein LOC120730097 n=1 Tax=Simochromis diagramma TaxID=43689 RepID=UPI001A7EB5A0|nr:uncharacterized protein LOC120730097 [Simochromis diagramma]
MSQVRQVVHSPADTLGGDNAPLMVLQVSRLAACFPQWRACAPSPWVLRTVAMGYRLQFWVKPPSFQGVVNTTVNAEAAMILREEIKALLQKRAIRAVPASETDKGWYSCYFVVPKRGGGLRPILDLRVLNTYLRTYRFKMLTLRQLLNAVGPGDWFATIDLTDAYFHVAIHPKHRQFLRFAFEGIAYEYLVLPFGLSLAPCIFTKCAKAALAPLRERGIRTLAYLDDWALVACSREQAETAVTGSVTHSDTGVLCELSKELTNPESADFFPRFGNMLAFQPRTFVGAQSGRVSSLPCSVSAGTQTAFPDDITLVGHDGIYDRHSAAWTVKNESISTLDSLSPPVCIASPPEEAAANCILHASSPSLEGAQASASGLSDWEGVVSQGGVHRCFPKRVGSAVRGCIS